MKRILISLVLLAISSIGVWAQRQTDALDRGLVAVKVSGGVYCSWRILPDEYYDVQYNLYRDGTKVNSEPLSVSNYTDASGTTSSTYTVEAVVRGTTQDQSEATSVWSRFFLDITMDHGDLTSTFIPNDACCADVDGDGEIEILLKFNNNSDANNGYMPEGYNGEYAIFEVYKLDGTKLWWCDYGPNMGDFQNNENNIVAFDWDGDGKAEAVMRAADGTVIHHADGDTTVVGNPANNYRSESGQSGQWFIHEGDEYLVYMNGETGEPYQILEYPLKRLEDGETSLSSAWGDGYGHRSTKHFFGAPFLDGVKPSIFLARGIYTRHKMIAYDVDATTHELTTRWTWNCSNSSSDWYGQGYHNYGVADVDWDGRDEIVFGSMVIDDNGNGLSTTGLGHGDAQHCSDFDPYTHGQEIFACLEENPGNNYRDATTSKLYYRLSASSDDGRSIMGNFIDSIPGAQGASSRDDNLVGSVCHGAIDGPGKSSIHIPMNFRVYWDGDLCEENFDYSSGSDSPGHIVDALEGEVDYLTGSLTNNSTKGTPCYQGDILGDWREEYIMRTSDNNIRVYTTTFSTDWRIYNLWFDHQYRNAMVWQMCGYNQPPHASFFLGEKEGITIAPPPLTLAGRTTIDNGATISSSYDDTHIIMYETNDMTVAVSNGAKPYIFTDNAPSWTQGHDNNDNITTETFTHTLTGGAFTGDMRLVKQGDGVLVLPAVTQTYTGSTDVWAGTLTFDGTMSGSRVWLNRHANLISTGGVFSKPVQANYNSTIYVGSSEDVSSIEFSDSLILGFGSRVVLDVYGGDLTADIVKAKVLTIETNGWLNGPAYQTPILEFVPHVADGESIMTEGAYQIGEIETIDGDISRLVIEGLGGLDATLSYEDGKLYLNILHYVNSDKTWVGSESDEWDTSTFNFLDEDGTTYTAFVPGDNVYFDDSATTGDIVVTGNMAPASMTFNNSTLAYTISGDSITGNGTLTKNGSAKLTISNTNHIGNTILNEGTLSVSDLANTSGVDYAALGGVDQTITVNDGATFQSTASYTTSQVVTINGTATFDVSSGATATFEEKVLAGTSSSVLNKTGSGALTLTSGTGASVLELRAGTFNAKENSSAVMLLPSTVKFYGGTLSDQNSEGSYSTNNANFVVESGYSGTLICDPRCEYKGTLSGAGTFNVYAGGIRGYFQGNWSAFEGTIVPGLTTRGSYDPSFDWNNSYGIPKATLSVASSVEFKNNGYAVEVYKVTGSGTISGSGAYTLMTDEDYTFSTTCSAPLVKKGTGKMQLLTLGKITNKLTVSDGTLTFSNPALSTLLCSTSLFKINETGTVIGRGLVQSLSMADEGQLYIQSTSTTSPAAGTIKSNAYIESTGNSVVHFLISSSSSASLLDVGTNLTLTNIEISLGSSYSPAAGDEFTLWTVGGTYKTGTLTNITLPELSDDLAWDTSELDQAEGILKVVASDGTGISGVSSDGERNYTVYTLGGVKVGEITSTANAASKAVGELGVAKGTYILRSTSGKKDAIKVVL